MGWTKDFTAVTVTRDGADLRVEGDSNQQNTIDDADVTALYVAIVREEADEHDALVEAVEVDGGGLVSPWDVTFVDPGAPYTTHNACLHLIGVGFVKGESKPHIWMQRKKVLLKTDPKPPRGTDC
jgi:hypothetical protein